MQLMFRWISLFIDKIGTNIVSNAFFASCQAISNQDKSAKFNFEILWVIINAPCNGARPYSVQQSSDKMMQSGITLIDWVEVEFPLLQLFKCSAS